MREQRLYMLFPDFEIVNTRVQNFEWPHYFSQEQIVAPSAQQFLWSARFDNFIEEDEAFG